MKSRDYSEESSDYLLVRIGLLEGLMFERDLCDLTPSQYSLLDALYRELERREEVSTGFGE